MTRQAALSEAWRPHVVWEGGRQIIEFGGRSITAAVREIVDVDRVVDQQTTSGVDRVVLSPWVNLLRYESEIEDGLRTTRLLNDALADAACRYPDRVSALGTVPLQAPEVAARELEAVMRTPGLHGVEITASVRGAYLGDDQFRPFWETAEATGAVVFIHPTTRGFDLPVFNDYYLWNAVGNPLETTVTAAHMVISGVMESFPRLKVVLAHGGGALLVLRGRLRHAHDVVPPARARLRESPEASLRRFYYDTVTHDVGVLRHVIEFAGADHVVLGSDYPFDMGVERPADAVQALELSAEEEAKILGANAARLLGLQR